MEVIGKVIKKYRKELKMSAQALGDKAGLSRGYIYEIESGKKTPSLDTLKVIAQALGIPAYEIVAEAELIMQKVNA